MMSQPAIDGKPLELLIKLLKMTTSSNDSEALLALRKANSHITAAGWDWESLMRAKVTVIEDPFTSLGPTSAPPAEVRRAPPAPSRPAPPRPASPHPQFGGSQFTAGHFTPTPKPRPAAPKPSYAPKPAPAPKPAGPPPSKWSGLRTRAKAKPNIDDLIT